MKWQKLAERLYVYPDSCNVFAVHGPEGMVIVNAGTGRWLDALSELPAKPAALLCTHFFRDHVAGAPAAAGAGIPVYAPYGEREQLEDPEGLFQRRETFIVYDNVWDLYAPIERVPVTGWLEDWQELTCGGVKLTVVPTPGVSLGAVSLACRLEPDSPGETLFCGEAIHSPGKIARVAPLQYNYNDLTGAVVLLYSLETIRRRDPALLAPSLGGPLIREPRSALVALSDNLKAALAGRPEYREALAGLEADALEEVTPHVWRSTLGSASTWFVVSDAGKALAIDYGYHVYQSHGARYPYPRNRRSLLHGIDGLRRRFGIDRIDVVLVTHFHDDHVNGIPLLQRLHGTRCWAGANFAEILADPMGYAFPCTWPEPVRVEAQPLETPIPWQEYRFRLHPMSGHTRWSTMVEFEADGRTFVATGDQYFFLDFARPGTGPCMHNHVYRNGASLGSFRASGELLRRIEPDMVLPGHGRAYPVGEGFHRQIEEYERDYRRIHERLMPLGDADAHFDVDSRAAWLVPYRVHRHEAAPLRFRAVVRNPFGRSAVLRARLAGPSGWRGESVRTDLAPRAEREFPIGVQAPAGTVCRRQPVALEIEVDGRPFGQVAEALVTFGHAVF
jgi:glyoxylase-like metal-dependent hydrolase (beta-lactamase superfamily II)